MNLIEYGARARTRGVLIASVLGLAVCILGETALAGEGALTLDEAIDIASREAPQVSSAQAALEGAQASLHGAGRLPDPEALVGVDSLPLSGADRFSLTRDVMTMRKVGLMQTVPSRAKRRFAAELASRETDVASAELTATRFEIASAAADAWIATAATDEVLGQFRKLRSDLALQAAAGRAGLGSGRGNAASALEGEAALARLDAEILALEQQLAIDRAELARWVGPDASRPFADLPWRRDLESPAQSLDENLSAHPPLAPFAARIEAARTEVDLARADKRPDWSAGIVFAKRGPDYSDMVSLEFRIGLPLFPRNRQNAAIATKLANVRAEEADQEAATRMHAAEIESTTATWRLGRKRLEHFEATLLPLARDRFRAVMSAYAAARGEMRAVLEALRDELELQREYVALEADVTRSWVFLHLLHSTRATP